MNVKPNIFPNCTQISIAVDVALFFSYEELVAVRVDGMYYVTDKHFSSTTSAHINRYVGKGKRLVAHHETLKELIVPDRTHIDTWKERVNAL